MASLLPKSIGFYINVLSYVAPKKAFGLAYKFFSNPRIGRLNAEDLPQILQKAQRETIQENEHSIQTYIWKGNDTIMLLAHGWESNASRWEKLLPHLLETGNTIIAIDAPAHGLSSGNEFNVPLYASHIHLVVKKHNPKYIIGHSMGGIAAVYYQYLHPNHPLEKMVLLGAPSDFSIILDNYLNLLSLNNNIRNAFHDYITDRFQINISEFSGQHFIQNTKLQGIIAHDKLDTIVLYSEAEKLASKWKNATFISTTGLGHSLHDVELNQKISAFLLGA
ncbi:alpha/beta hydrolase [Flavobacterium sp.]|uniref:alpha/beta fold hydrolase n=1 Tax=Flavobacterium sp. TaxID=239 RepID=UPI00286CC9A3|nr:alpha/beta hydrolase [Flavobacterium sp.]